MPNRQLRVGVMGMVGSPEGDSRYRWVVSQLKKNDSNISIVPVPKDIIPAIRKKELGWGDQVFDSVLEYMEQSDVIVTYHPVNAPTGLAHLGWLTALAWEQGKPVIYVAYNQDFIKLSIVVVKCLHAHIQSAEELRAYDFDRMPLRYFNGEII